MADFSTEDIVNYLNGNLAAEAAVAFEQAVASDPALAAELEAQAEFIGGEQHWDAPGVVRALDQEHSVPGLDPEDERTLELVGDQDAASLPPDAGRDCRGRIAHDLLQDGPARIDLGDEVVAAGGGLHVHGRRPEEREEKERKDFFHKVSDSESKQGGPELQSAINRGHSRPRAD